MLRIGAALFAFLCVSPAGAAETIRLSLPVDCEMGVVCFIQQYVDQEAGAGAGDYQCNSMSYDDHRGTDFRVRDYVDMRRGIAVIAAAPGVVSATRDGMPDISVREVGIAALLGNLAGNGVVIDHGDGWQTQYNHLQNNSIEAKPGDKVERGQRLALIGLSGRTEFPHLDLAVRRNGRVVDPFTGLNAPGGCNGKKSPLWRGDTLAATRYLPSAILSAGFSDHEIKRAAASHGLYPHKTVNKSAAALVFWAEVMGTQKDDVEEIRLVGPDGTVLFEKREALTKNQAARYRFGGVKRKGSAFPIGRYVGEYRLIRRVDGQLIPAVETVRTIQVK